ncbi:GNAT family N-acetyltransferase [Actinoallomurus sp. NPDC052308]|uniref:GNAT family N-acetyltransferase n=1 Tax=Actinoallomurus sp. NPDC052308 TaxID=3155530 RepID=UPI00342957DF
MSDLKRPPMTAAGDLEPDPGGLEFVRLDGDEVTISKWAGVVAVITRQAYDGSDPIHGLPPPDGSRDTAAEVADELRAGIGVWLALTPDGTPAGAARVRAHEAGYWEVSRVATAPAGKKRGVARRLLRAIEDAARDAVVPRVRLNAVVERCLPSFYAALGYRVVTHWPSPDKPLTEVTMERDPATPWEPDPFPWTAMPPPAAPVVCWLTDPAGLWAVVVDDADDVFAAVRSASARLVSSGVPAVRLAGVDLPTEHAPDPQELLAGIGEEGADVRYAGPVRASVPAHVAPRTVHPEYHAFWRLPPGREAEISPWRW